LRIRKEGLMKVRVVGRIGLVVVRYEVSSYGISKSLRTFLRNIRFFMLTV